jgi:hypothetical protein
MLTSKALLLTMMLVPLASQSQADTLRDASKPNLIDQKCENSNGLSIRVVNMDGQCQAFWKCDATVFEVKCEGVQCECRHDAASFFNKITYDACDSDKLASCFNLPG